MDEEVKVKKRRGWSMLLDIPMLVINAIFLRLAIRAYSNGLTEYGEIGWLYFIVVMVAGCRLLPFKTVVKNVNSSWLPLKTIVKKCVVTIVTVLVYVLDIFLLYFSVFLLLINGFDDYRFENPNKYNKEMFYGGFYEIIPEEIPQSAMNIDFHYETDSFDDYEEAFLQYSLPQAEYAEFKKSVMKQNDGGTKSKFFENSYDVDVGHEDVDSESYYSYDFVSFCDEDCVIRFVCAYSYESTETYFKNIDGRVEKK